MKDLGKVLLMLFTGLTVAVVVYPFFHETGHGIAALLVGGRVAGYRLLPSPCVLCGVENVSPAGVALIGAGGPLLPAVVAAALPRPKKGFCLWYAGFVLRCICILSAAIAAAAVFLFAAGRPVADEDVTTVLNAAPELAGAVLAAALFVSGGLTVGVAKDRPINRITGYISE